MKNYKNIEFLSNSGLDPLATKPAFNVEPTPARQRYCLKKYLLSAQTYLNPSITVFVFGQKFGVYFLYRHI